MRRLLMGGLSPGRDVARAPRLRASRAIADRKNIRIARGLKCGGNDKLAYPVGLETIQTAQNVRGFHSSGPDHKLGMDEAAIGQLNTIRANFGHFGIRPYIDAQAF